MLGKIDPRLRRSDVVVNSFSSCISNASEELSRAPEMPFSEIFSQPRMLPHKFERTVSLKELQSFTNTHCWRQFNKQVDMVDSDVKFVDFTSMFNCNFCDESLDINSNPIEFHRISGVFRFPHKVEGILPEGMFKTFQFHFFAPPNRASKKAHANLVNLFQEGSIYPPYVNNLTELNLLEVGSPPQLKSKGIRAPIM